jgi:tRNA(Ile)-lysidine synthase TilS/MesJ
LHPQMKCTRCKALASFQFPFHNLKLCEDCLDIFFQKHVAKTIKKYQMLKTGEKIMLGVSGGKDSLVAWKVLHDLGYTPVGVHFDLKLGEFSERSVTACQNMAQRFGYELRVYDLNAMLGVTVQEIAWANRRPYCAVCGGIKRYYFNMLCKKEGFDCVATGHNLDDESARLLGNMMRGNQRYMVKQWPLTPASEDGFFSKKIKPLFLITEAEIKAYAKVHGLEVLGEICPKSKGATSPHYKAAMNLMEQHMPGTRRSFMMQFLGEKDGPPQAERLKSYCGSCGYPTFIEKCSHCLLLDRTKRWLQEKNIQTLAGQDQSS